MKLPKSFSQISQTLRRFAPNFNSCLPAFLWTRQKPSDLPTEIDDPLISSNIIISDSQQQFNDSAGDPFVKSVSPLSNTNLHPSPLNNPNMDPGIRPESGAGVFAMKEYLKDKTDLSSEIKPPEQRSQRPLTRVNAIRSYHRRRPLRPSEQTMSSSRQVPVPQRQILPQGTQATQATQPNTINSQLPYTPLANTFRKAYDSSGSDSEGEETVVAPAVMNMVGSFAANTADFLAKNLTNVATSFFAGSNSSNSSRPAPFPSLPTRQQPEIQPVTQNSSFLAQGQKKRVDLANEQLMLLLPGTKFRIFEISPEEKIQMKSPEPVANRNSPGKLDPRILDRFGGGVVVRSTENSRSASPSREFQDDEIKPAPINYPSPISPAAQLTNMPSTPSKYPEFTDTDKIRIFNYINQKTDLGYTNIPDKEKPLYFDYSLFMIDQKKKKILEADSSAVKRNAVGLVRLNNSSVEISDDEKIKLFDLMNKSLDFKFEDKKINPQKIKKFEFILRAVKFQKTSIREGLDNVIKKHKEGIHNIGGPAR